MARTKYADWLADLERGVTKLEKEMEELKAKFAEKEKPRDWWNHLPQMTPEEEKSWEAMYEEGRKYRESLRPKPRTPAKKKRSVKAAEALRAPKARLKTKSGGR